MNNPAPALELAEGQRSILGRLARSQAAPHRDVLRARALLLAADGVANTRIAEQVGVSAVSVRAWRERFAAEGLAKFGRVRPGRGRKPSIAAAKVQAIVHATLHDKPPGGTHWSCRSMAEAQGVSRATVQRIWQARGLPPQRVETFKLCNDKHFEHKLVDVVGLYLNPPEQAVVLCLDENSQIQARDRTQPTLPLKRGRAGTMTHDSKRNGTTTLFAALNVLTGVVIGRCLPRHRTTKLLKFLRLIDRQAPKGLHIHMILDNHGTHQHDHVAAWLDKHPRFELHFTPTSSCWLNRVERWFGNLTEKALRRGVLGSAPDLIAAIEPYPEANNTDPKPFVWTATTEQILEKVRRGRVALEEAASQKRDTTLAVCRREEALDLFTEVVVALIEWESHRQGVDLRHAALESPSRQGELCLDFPGRSQVVKATPGS